MSHSTSDSKSDIYKAPLEEKTNGVSVTIMPANESTTDLEKGNLESKDSAADESKPAAKPWWRRKRWMALGLVLLLCAIVSGTVAGVLTAREASEANERKSASSNRPIPSGATTTKPNPIIQATPPAKESNCPDYHILVTRGSFEPAPEGMLAVVTKNVATKLKKVTSSGTEYPALLPYLTNNSLATGTAQLKRDIANWTESCPDTNLALIGYSQGGAATMDAVCGGGDDPQIGPATSGLTREEARNVKAIAVFGESRFVHGLSYDMGTNKAKDGLFARKQSVAECKLFAPIIHSWCDENDIRCASGDSWQVHHDYMPKYKDVATQYLVDMLTK